MAKSSARVLDEATIHYKNPVVSVESLRSTDNPSGKVIVRTSNGSESSFDAVLITIPLGWLKRHKEAIKPLTEPVSRAIDEIGFGNLEKVLIEFPTSFWEPEGSSEEEKISFVHWLSPQYASSTNPKAWRLECVCFSAFPASFRRNILLFYTYGDCSRHITSLIKGTKGQQREEILREFFEPYYSRLPNYDKAECTPLRYLATEWSQDEFSGYGSYSNFQIGVADAAADVVALRTGMPEARIYFAGEHCAPFDGLGTVAGAYNSGELVARRMLSDTQAFSN